MLSTVDLYDNPYSFNVKEEVEDDNKAQAKKRKYNKTGKYKKTGLEHQLETSENIENKVKTITIIIF